MHCSIILTKKYYFFSIWWSYKLFVSLFCIYYSFLTEKKLLFLCYIRVFISVKYAKFYRLFFLVLNFLMMILAILASLMESHLLIRMRFDKSSSAFNDLLYWVLAFVKPLLWNQWRIFFCLFWEFFGSVSNQIKPWGRQKCRSLLLFIRKLLLNIQQDHSKVLSRHLNINISE